MEYKQLSPTLVIRVSDGLKIAPDDPEYLKWLEDGNNPFPPDPPLDAEIKEMEE